MASVLWNILREYAVLSKVGYEISVFTEFYLSVRLLGSGIPEREKHSGAS